MPDKNSLQKAGRKSLNLCSDIKKREINKKNGHGRHNKITSVPFLNMEQVEEGKVFTHRENVQSADKQPAMPDYWRLKSLSGLIHN
ncbi:hypothetical protein FLI01_19885 [Salmonella enterica subsp. enterica serovar Bareilly]|uniref:Uncharacterized protein n=1 Tax=Salmonella enterica subsp. enterica serovar Poona TaxID=436295 RepID=A0A5W6ZPV1_SALET|nr:hypothetical protein [Salmonella enterica]EBS1726202.1 hypothetical protein [Salmonella enterica subsp. enterica serovar Poona]EBX5888800.1 hypothetical protein [Salmonella enterica subsp. enterica serovar Reading]EBZ4887824.1 hypothetical protein [Salmonella enterica subsp. enterica serovar Bredeney]ECB6249756.1 hypothetical protein [Salmonella enterica subsp. enterica serovar London]ECD8052404.1 hypothetical protein [Salmonella enterica subsp. enterica serovar Bareilly]ECE6269415.1 hypot